jgi:hypothetical protein
MTAYIMAPSGGRGMSALAPLLGLSGQQPRVIPAAHASARRSSVITLDRG